MSLNLAELPELIASMRKDSSNCLKDVVASQQFLSNKFEEIVGHMKLLQNQIQLLRSENHCLKQSIKNLSENAKSITQVVHQAELDIDCQQRSELSTNAIILGIPRTAQENTDDIVLKTCEALGYSTAKHDMVSCCRIPCAKSENSPIRITFKSAHCKEKLMEHKKQYGTMDISAIQNQKLPMGTQGRVVIRDELTPLSRRLLQELKGLQAALDLRYVWPGRNGAIMVRKTEKSKAIPILSRHDIQKLLQTPKK